MFAAATPSSPPMLYRQYFTREERAMLDASPLASAVNEISLLRVLLSRVIASANKERRSLRSYLIMLRAISTAGLIIASLARFHWYSLAQGTEDDPLLASIAVNDVSEL